MSDTITNINRIQEIAWLLSRAQWEKKLDVDATYIWGYPKTGEFNDIRERSKSMFSSGNAVKTQEVRQHIQSLPLSSYLYDPWIVKKFEESIVTWMTTDGHHHRLKNLQEMKYVSYSLGTQETFTQFYFVNRNKRLRVFKTEYWWHMESWEKFGLDWEYIENDDIKPNDAVIISCPFSALGTQHPLTNDLLDQCDKVGATVLLDLIYLPMCREPVDIDLTRPCIDTVTLSLSKTFEIQSSRIAVRMSKNKFNDPMQLSNDENICNRIGAGIGFELIKHFPFNYNVEKYSNAQKHWCRYLGLSPTSVVHFAIGDDYVKGSRNGFASKYNLQSQRYNLGVLYENEKLLKRCGFDPYIT